MRKLWIVEKMQMDPKNLPVMLQKASELAEHTRFCPEDRHIARLYEGNLKGATFERVLRHVAECQYCQSRLGMLARLESDEPDSKIPEKILAAGKQLGRASTPQRSYRAPAWAATAMVVVAAYTLIAIQPQISQNPQSLPPVSLSGDSEARPLRGLDATAPKPRVLTPAEGALVAAGDLVIRWTEYPGSLYYDLYVLSDAGDPVVDLRVDGTEWAAHPATLFAPGADYYVRVEAHLANTRTISTDHVFFSVEGQ